MEREKDVIDTTMIQAEGRWYRFTMNDVTKRVCMEWASDPKGPYEEIKSETLTKLSGVEGPEIYRAAGWQILPHCRPVYDGRRLSSAGICRSCRRKV